jgi:hypothetical protein
MEASLSKRTKRWAGADDRDRADGYWSWDAHGKRTWIRLAGDTPRQDSPRMNPAEREWLDRLLGRRQPGTNPPGDET